MSVELLDTTRFHGFRVRRQIAGKTFQEYFSLKANGKRMRGADRAKVKAKAESRDSVLAKQQAKAKTEAKSQKQTQSQSQTFENKLKKYIRY